MGLLTCTLARSFFTYIEVGDIESEWTMFIADETCKSCGLRVMAWWTPVVREAVKLKKESFQALVVPGVN